MSKSQSTLVFILLIVLLGFVGFLAWQLSAFHTEYENYIGSKQGQLIENQKLNATVTEFTTKITEHDTALQEITTQISSLSTRLKEELRNDFVAQPEYVSTVPLFTTEPINETTIKTNGDLPALDVWQQRNKFFLDNILQESVILDFDSIKQKIVVTDIISDGLFYQMGLRKHDMILSVDGKIFNTSDDVRTKLTQFKNTKLELLRDGKKTTLDISYTSSKPNRITLAITQTEFKALLPQLLNTLKLVPAMKNNAVIGVRIVSVEAANPFALMGLHADDVITKINGGAVNLTSFVDTLTQINGNLNIQFTRTEEEKMVVVGFAP